MAVFGIQNLNFLDFNTCICNLKENQKIPSENISKEDSLMANVVLKKSTACPNEGSQQSEILASKKDTIPQEVPNALDVKEKGKIKGGLILDEVFNLVQSSKNMCQITILNF